MKIGIDVQTTFGQKTGFGFYVKNLVEHLPSVNRRHEYVRFSPATHKDLSTPQRWWWDQVEIPRRAKAAAVDILHQPAFSAPVFYPGKVVVTVHDLIAMVHGADIPFFSRQFFARWMPFSYRFADHIIAVSQHTKQDLIRLLGVPAEKISVIYEAASSQLQPIRKRDKLAEVKRRYKTGDDYLLHVGTLNPRKNLGLLIDAFAAVVRQFPSYKLVITGKKGWYYEGLFRNVAHAGLDSKVVFTGYVEDADKPALYSGARAFLFPSLYEGFGLPPLEAMRCGTPVIASSESSIPEVVGKAGILLSPHDSDGWIKAISSLLSSPSLQRELAAKGLKQATQFSWDTIARETVEVYEQVVRQP